MGSAMIAANAVVVTATTPELPPDAGGYVAVCPDAANGGLQTVLVPADQVDTVMTEGSVGPPCAVAPGPVAYGPMLDPETGTYVGEISDGIYWVTDGVYKAMFATTGEGVIVVDAYRAACATFLCITR